MNTAPPQSQNATPNTYRFISLFFSIYLLLHIAYFSVSDDFLQNTVYPAAFINLSVYLVNSIQPDEQVKSQQNALVSSKVKMEVVRGCDGIGVLLMLTSAIFAFSTSIQKKLVGWATGLMLLYSINIIRIVGLYFISAYQITWFLPLHSYFIPGFVVIFCCIFFIGWIQWTAKDSCGV